MPTYRFSASGHIHATPAVVWDILADYRHGHFQIAPKPAFSNMMVETGGYGEGTVFHFTFKAAGATRQMRQRVLTPEPGRVLIERDVDGEGQTCFTLTSQDDGASVLVDIATDVPSHKGLYGAIERAMAPLLAPTMRKLYLEELENLDRLAQTWSVGAARQADER